MILLTGANGFIGSHLRNAIDCITVDYSGCDYNGDLSDKDFVNALPDVDTVIHLAAFNSTKNFYSTPLTVLNSIVTPTMNLLERYPTAHFVYAGSSEEYAGTIINGWGSIPTTETVALTISDITNPRWCYAAGKIAMESAVISNGIENNSTWTILRFHNVYGPGQANHFIPEFLERMNDKENILYGHSDTRSFCFVKDAVHCVKEVLSIKNEIINIGANEEHTILDVAERLLSINNIDKSTIVLEDSPPGSTPRRAPDISKLLSIIDNYEFTSLDDGLTQTTDYYNDIRNK